MVTPTNPLIPFGPFPNSYGVTAQTATSPNIFTTADVVGVSFPQGTFSYSFYLALLADARLNLGQVVKTQLRNNALASDEFFKYAAATALQLLTQFDQLQAFYLRDTTDSGTSGPIIAGGTTGLQPPPSGSLNGDALIMQTAISTQEDYLTNVLPGITADYQAALDTWNPNPVAGPAFNAFQAAQQTYIDALNSYTVLVNNANAAVTAYNADVAAWNDIVPQINQDIQAQNLSRNSQGQLPIPNQTTLTPFSYSSGPTMTPPTLIADASGGAQPPAVTIPSVNFPANDAFPVQIPDPRTLATPSAVVAPVWKAVFSVLQTQRNTFNTTDAIDNLSSVNSDLRGKLLLRPDSFTPPAGNLTLAQGPLGPGYMTLSIGNDNTASNAIIGQALYNAAMGAHNTDPNLYGSLLNFTIQSAIQASQASVNLGLTINSDNITQQVPSTNPSVQAGLGLGYLNTLIGLLGGNGLQSGISTLISQSPALGDLTPDQVEALTQSLSGPTTLSLLQIGLGTISTAINTPALGDVFNVAALLANPGDPANFQQFTSQSKNFQKLLTQYGAPTVATPLAHLFALQLQQQGISAPQALITAGHLAHALSSQGLGASPEALQGTISGILSQDLGAKATGALSNSIFSSSIQFAASASLKQNVQTALIQQAGPQQALNLSDQIVQAAYGFSVDFGQSTVDFQAGQELNPTSAVQIATDQFKHFTKEERTAALQQTATFFNNTSNTNINRLLQFVVEPGHNTYSMMSQGFGGTQFKRGGAEGPT